MKSNLVFILFFILCLPAFAQPIDEIENPLVPHENSIEIGLKLGGGFTYPARPTSIDGGALEPVFKLFYLGTTVDQNGAGKVVMVFPRTIALNAAYRKKGTNPENSWAVKMGIARTQQNYYFNYPEPLNNPAFSQVDGWVQDIKYNSAQISVQRSWAKYFGQLSFATTLGKIKEDDQALTGSKFYDYVDANGNGAKLTINALKTATFLLTPEVGMHGIYKNTVPYELSIGYNLGLSKIMQQKFEMYQNGSYYTTSTVTYGLNSLFVNLNVPITVAKWAKEEHKPKKEPKPEKPKQPEKEVVVESTPHKEIKKFHQQESFTVENSNITLKYWDNLTADGDIISLYLNGDLIVKKQKVETKQKSVSITLKPGENFIIMRAQNEGRIPPNTAAISVDDGKKTQTVVLRAKKRKNVGIRVWYEPKK